jgi:spermidine synthase
MKPSFIHHSRRSTQHTEWLNDDYGFFYTITNRLQFGATKYQTIELVDTKEFGRVLILDGITQAAQRGECYYHEPMVHPAMCTHPCPQKVLVIGAGDGGIIREVLKYPCVKTLDLAELDEGVIEFSRKYLPTVNHGAFDDPRVRIHITDGRKFVEKNRACFDMVIMDMTDPFGPAKFLYTKDFFRSVARSFRDPRGVFAMHTESPVARPRTFGSIQGTLRSVFGNVRPLYAYIHMYATLWSITVVSDQSDMAKISSAAVDKKLARYGIKDLMYYTGKIHEAAQVSWPHLDALLAKPARILTDKHPDIPDDITHD